MTRTWVGLLAPGTTFTFCAHKYTVLHKHWGHVLVLAAEFEPRMQFQPDGSPYPDDYRVSPIRDYLEHTYLANLQIAGAKPSDFVLAPIDLSTTDGSRADTGEFVAAVGLLSLRQYASYAEFIPKLPDAGPWWLVTADAPANLSAHVSICVEMANGNLDWAWPNYSPGCFVRPILHLAHNTLVEVNASDLAKRPDDPDADKAKDGCDFCKRFDFSGASCEVTKHGARIKLACGTTGYPKEQQFRFCPVCGKKLHADQDKGKQKGEKCP